MNKQNIGRDIIKSVLIAIVYTAIFGVYEWFFATHFGAPILIAAFALFFVAALIFMSDFGSWKERENNINFEDDEKEQTF